MNYLNTGLNSFVNNGTDEELIKAIRGTPVKVIVHGKHGDYQATRYKKINQNTSEFRHAVQKQDYSTSNINKDYYYMSFEDLQIYSLKQIVDKYHSNELSGDKYSSLNSFIKSNYFVSTGSNTTADCYRKQNGEYTNDRVKKVHNKVLRSISESGDKPPKGTKPVCFLYGGGSGSGKSSVVSVTVEPIIKNTGLKFAKVDCDSIKAMLPEHEMFLNQDPNTAAYREHMESSDLCKKAIDLLIEQGKCFCYDGTMSDFEKYDKIVSKLKDKGYEVHVVATDVPVEVAIERGKNRERQIPDHIFYKTHKGFAEAFPEILSLDVDSISLYDNSQPSGDSPTLIMSTDEGIQNNELWNRFLKKGNHDELIYTE